MPIGPIGTKIALFVLGIHGKVSKPKPPAEPDKGAKPGKGNKAAEKRLKAAKRTEEEDLKEFGNGVSKKDPAEVSWFRRAFIPYFNPQLQFSLGQLKAEGRDGIKQDSPEMEETLNTTFPFFDISLGFFDNFIPAYGNDSSDYAFKIKPLLAVSYARNYSIGEDDQSWTTDVESTFHLKLHDFALEGNLYFNYEGNQRKWPSLSLPNDHEYEGGGGFAVQYNPEWMSMALYLKGDGSYLDGEFTTYETNTIFDQTINRLYVGGSVSMNDWHNKNEFAPKILLSAEGLIYGNQQIKIGPNRTKGELSGWKAGGGLAFGKKVLNLAAMFEHENEDLEDQTKISQNKFSLALEIPYVGRLTLASGWAEGTYHYYDIDVPFFFNWQYDASTYATPFAGPVRFGWGLKGTAAIYSDNEYFVPVDRGIIHNPEYIQYGVAAFMKMSFQ